MAKGITEFKSERLLQILKVREISRLQLSILTSVSPATVSKWCKNQQYPTQEALEKIASVTNVTQEWFTRYKNTSTSSILYRSNAAAHVSARDRLEVRIEWLEEIAIQLEHFVDFPDVRLPILQEKNPLKITDSDIEDMAKQCREFFGIGDNPIQNLMMLVEGSGVIVTREETATDKIEGLSRWSNVLNRPVILLSSDKNNAFRSRFDLAHELAHIVLHRFIPHDLSKDKEIYKLMEYQAHTFAGALLLPANFLDDLNIPFSLNSLIRIKHKWGISIGATIKRLSVLEIIDSTEETNLYKQYSARGWRKKEPDDDLLNPEIPKLLKRTIDLLDENSILPRSKVSSYFGLSNIDIEMLMSLPIGYLSTKGNNVIDISLKIRPNKTSASK